MDERYIAEHVRHLELLSKNAELSSAYERKAFIREAAMRAMQGLLSGGGQFYQLHPVQIPREALSYATALWDALQESEGK